MKNILENQFLEHQNLVEQIKFDLIPKIVNSADIIINAFKNGNKVLLFGNGGSAADAQHIAAELTGRFVKERRGLPAIAITTDSSALTAIGNDYGFENIFKRQIEALAVKGDVLIGISTSGNSINVINAIQKGNDLGCVTISLTGNSGGHLKDISKINLNINNNITARIQEMHILIGHLICFSIDQNEFTIG